MDWRFDGYVMSLPFLINLYLLIFVFCLSPNNLNVFLCIVTPSLNSFIAVFTLSHITKLKTAM